MSKFLRLSTSISVALGTFVPGLALAIPPVVTINSSQTTIVDPYYGSQSVFVNPYDGYYGSQSGFINPYYGSQSVIVNPGRRSQTVIVAPSNGSQTVIVNSGRRSQTLIVSPTNTYPGSYPIYQQPACSSMIMGSPIVSPAPINGFTGRFC